MFFRITSSILWLLNSLRPRDAYMLRLANIIGEATSHYLNQCCSIVNWTLNNKLHFNRNSNIFLQENVFENVVCEMSAILSRPQCVNVLVLCISSHPHLWYCTSLSRPQCVNSLRPSDAIWRHRSGSTLAQAMACCLTAPSHCLNQCWLIISNVLWHASEGNFIRDTWATIH